jgi:adenosylmethionine-8-amino-7-oxononanoate aminotransferase
VIEQEGPENISAFIAEPVLGTSLSAVVPPPEYYPMIREICDEYDVLLIVDEVMSGLGRTGMNWGIEHWQVVPDIITTAKGLSSGYSPLAATILAEKVWKSIDAGSQHVMHSYTFGGNPISCAAGVAVLDYIEENDLVARAAEMGDKLLGALKQKLGSSPFVGDIRGKGLFTGIELVADRETKDPFPPSWNVGELVEEEALEQGLLMLAGVTGTINGVAGDHLELIPPYTINEEHVDEITSKLGAALAKVTSDLPHNT